MNIFNSKYDRLIKEYYSKNSCPLLEFLTITGGKISYSGIPITRNNTNKILMKTKRSLSLEERIVKGLPLSKEEHHLIKNKK